MQNVKGFRREVARLASTLAGSASEGGGGPRYTEIGNGKVWRTYARHRSKNKRRHSYRYISREGIRGAERKLGPGTVHAATPHAEAAGRPDRDSVLRGLSFGFAPGTG